MATTVKPRDLDLPEGYHNSARDRTRGYPTGSPRGDKEKTYARYVRALWDEQQDFLATLHRVWTQNLLFLSGRQWWVADRSGVYRPARVPSYREQPVTNLTMAFFRNYLAKALKNRPSWTVMPATPDPEDIHSAETADQVLEAKWQELRLSRVLKRAVAWTIATGNGFLLPYWNTNTGRMIPSTVTMEVPVLDEFGIPNGETEEVEVLLNKKGEPQLLPDGRPDPAAIPHMIDEGDVGVRAIDPRQVLVNPEAENDDDVFWFIVAEYVTIRELAITHPDLAQKVVPEEHTQPDDAVAISALSNLMAEPGMRLTPHASNRDQKLDRVLKLHYYEKPTEEYPMGRYWVAVGKDWLAEDPQPLPDAVWPPLVHLTDLDTPGSYYAGSVLEQIIPLNKHYNEINGQIKEHHNLMAKGKWLVPRGSGIRQAMITNAPGEVIQYNPGFKPEMARVEQLPQTVIEERNRVLSDYETVSGIHRVSMGKAPPGVSAGVAFLQLQEADDTDLGPFLEMLEQAVAQLAGSILQIAKDRYTTTRLIYIVGENRKYQVRHFKNSDLRGAGDVRPQAGSAFPWLKTAQQSMMLTLAAQMPQLFTDPETGQFDTAKFARLLPIGGLGAVSDDTDLDVQEAQREEEIYSLYGSEGQETPQVGFWQNHDIHYRQHIRLVKSAQFFQWPLEAQQAFLKHVQETQQARDQKAVQMAQMSAMAQGNAPKELYQQGVAGMGDPNAVGGMLSPEEQAAIDEAVPSEGWVEEEMMPPPSPAAPGGMAGGGSMMGGFGGGLV